MGGTRAVAIAGARALSRMQSDPGTLTILYDSRPLFMRAELRRWWTLTKKLAVLHRWMHHAPQGNEEFVMDRGIDDILIAEPQPNPVQSRSSGQSSGRSLSAHCR